MTSEEWAWVFAPTAVEQFEGLETDVQNRIVSKLDDVVDDQWREPGDHLEPLTGGPFDKLRVGQYRLACVLNRSDRQLEVHRIEHRSGAFTADDD